MNTGGDAADQVVRMTLEGSEVALKISGEAAKNIAIMLVAALKEEEKTHGKARLGTMLKSGKELKVFSIRQKDLETFSEQAKNYGVLYCVLKSKDGKDENAVIDVLARADDAPKIQRITEKFHFNTTERASVISDIERAQKEKQASRNPAGALPEKDLSGQDSGRTGRSGSMTGRDDKPSVREKLAKYQSEKKRKVQEKNRERSGPFGRAGSEKGRSAPRMTPGIGKER